VSYASYLVAIKTSVFPWKMYLDHCKKHGCGQKKTEGTSFAMFGVGT